MDIQRRTQNGHIRNDTRDVLRSGLPLVFGISGLTFASAVTVQQDYLLQARQMQALSFAVHIPLVCFGIALPALVLFAEWLNFYFPAVMIGYFDDLSDAIRRSEVDESPLADIARRHSMEIVGPVPESYV